MIRLQSISTAHIACKRSILIKGMPESETQTITCFAYYMEVDGRKILVDTGIWDLNTVNRTKSSPDDWSRGEGEYPVSEALHRLGVEPPEIDLVFLTHSHYDHCSALPIFKNAQICMSKKELDFMQSDSNSHKPFCGPVLDFLAERRKTGRLILVKDRMEVAGAECVVVGGHTPGSMLLYLDDQLFTGDAVFTLENIEKKLPIGFCDDMAAANAAMLLCCAHPGTIRTGHDPLCAVNQTEDRNV